MLAMQVRFRKKRKFHSLSIPFHTQDIERMKLENEYIVSEPSAPSRALRALHYILHRRHWRFNLIVLFNS